MITKDSIETAYSFLHQKRQVYIHSQLYEVLSDHRSDFLRDHKRFEKDITEAVKQLESML